MSMKYFSDPARANWNTKSVIYVDHASGSRNGAGSLSSPLLDLNDWNDRLGDLVIDGDVTPLVTIYVSGDTTNPLRLTPRLANGAVVVIVGTRTNTALSGTLTTWQDRVQSTKTDAQFSWSGLQVSWTASGAVGQFLQLTGLGSNVATIVGLDLGTKTALTCGAFDLDGVFPVEVGAGDLAFQGYSVPAITSNKIHIAPSGSGILIFEDLEVGDQGELHNVIVSGDAQVSFFGCRLFGVDQYNHYLSAPFGCYVQGWRNYGRDLIESCVFDTNGGAYINVEANGFSDVLDFTLTMGTVSVQQGAALYIEGDMSGYGSFDGIQNVGGVADILGFFWVKNPARSVLNNGGGCFIRYADAAKIGSTGTPPTHKYYSGAQTADTLPLAGATSAGGIVLR